MMASADEFTITVTGKGGHAGYPQDAVDTTLVAAQIVVDVCETLFRHAPKPIPDPEHFML